MDQEKIGKFIRELRKREKMSQKEFARKYGVTFQAVSKWENGKNIPDIVILKKICEDYGMNLDDFLKTTIVKKRSTKTFIIVGVFIVAVIFIVLFMRVRKDEGFEFKTISTSCEDFNLYGSIAYNNKSSSIYISNITYCGGDDENTYNEINCVLYEIGDNGKTKISELSYKDENSSLTLEKFLQVIEFKIDDYAQSCKKYKENSLRLEIEAKTDGKNEIFYEIPMRLEDNCTK